MAVLVFLLVATSISPLTAQESTPEPIGLRPDSPTYALHGPYWVGTREFVIDDADRPLRGTMWYPALNPNGDEERATYLVAEGVDWTEQGYALANAAPDASGGPYPLVIYSHGLGSMRLGSLYFTEHLASYGFVVMAVDHSGSTYADGYGEGMITNFVDRPLDVRRVIDDVTSLSAAGQPCSGLIDSENVAVAGWSFGGYTAFAAGGARMGFSENAAVEQCRQGQSTDAGCSVISSERLLIAKRGQGRTPGEEWPGMGDERVKAVIGLAPWLLTISDPGFSEVNVPTLVIFGTGDTDTPPEVNGARAYNLVGSAYKTQVTLAFGFHGLFGNACDLHTSEEFSAARSYYQYCSDTVWDMDRAHDLTNHFATAFLLDVLKSDANAGKALRPDTVSFSGVELQTTLK